MTYPWSSGQQLNASELNALAYNPAVFTAGESLSAGNPVYIIDYPATTVGYDNSARFNNASAGSSMTNSFTVGNNSNRLLLVAVTCSNSQTINAVTYGGVAMTALFSNTSSDSSQKYSLYYLAAPATGANNLVVTASATSTITANAYSYYNAAQGAPQASNNASGGNGAAVSASLTNLTARALMFCVVTNRLGSGPSGTAYVNHTLAPSGGQGMYTGDSGEVTSIQSKTISAVADSSGLSTQVWIYSIATVTTNNAQRVFKTSGSQAQTANAFLGIAQSVATAGQSVTIATAGIDSNQSGLTVGAQYYLGNTSGALSTSAGTVSRKAGIAVAPTKLLITNVW